MELQSIKNRFGIIGNSPVLNMKINRAFALMLVLCSLVFSTRLFSQEKPQKKVALSDSLYKSDDGNYVSVYYSKGKVLQKSIFYVLKNGRYQSVLNYGDSTFKILNDTKFNLFKIIYDNYDSLIELKNKGFTNPKKGKQFLRDYGDDTINFSQLGIKYHDLHFNHFPKFYQEDIAKARNSKIANGMEAINRLYALFEEIEK